MLQPLYDDHNEDHCKSGEYSQDTDKPQKDEGRQDKKKHDKPELAEKYCFGSGFMRAQKALHAPGERPDVKKPQCPADEDAEGEFFPFDKR